MLREMSEEITSIWTKNNEIKSRMKWKRAGYKKELNILKMSNIASEIKNSINEIYSRLDTGKEELANWEWVIKNSLRKQQS